MTVSDYLTSAEAEEFTRDLLKQIGDTTPDLIYAKDLQSRMIFANHAVLKTVGRTWDEIRGRADSEWHDDPEEGRRFVENDARIMATGETEQVEEPLTGIDGLQIYISTKSPLRASDGKVIGLVGISKNITVRKNEERLRKMLLQELDHRVKNTLTIVQALARQTFKNEKLDRAVWDAFEGRLIAMSKAHGMLIKQNWVGADVLEVVHEGLAARAGWDNNRFTIGGPSAWLDAQTALALAMAIHELCTNAVKYGSLSIPQGRVAIAWHLDSGHGKPILDLSWREHGGPQVVPPAHRGFGSSLIEQAFAQNGAHSARISFRPEGAEFQVRLALGERVPKRLETQGTPILDND